MRKSISRCKGEEVRDRDLAWRLQDEHACRVIGYLSDEAPRMSFTTARRQQGGRDDNDINLEDEDQDEAEVYPPKKRTRFSSTITTTVEDVEILEDAQWPIDSAARDRNPFAHGQQAGEPSDDGGGEEEDWGY